jgi:hypothetical protein
MNSYNEHPSHHGSGTKIVPGEIMSEPQVQPAVEEKVDSVLISVDVLASMIDLSPRTCLAASQRPTNSRAGPHRSQRPLAKKRNPDMDRRRMSCLRQAIERN